MKTELMEKLVITRDELLNALASLSAEQLDTTAVDEWSVKDIVGHISYWEQILLDHIRETFTQGRPRPMAESNPDGNINAREAAKRKSWSRQRVRAEFENTRRAVIERVDQLTETDLSFQVPSPWRNEDRIYSVAEMIDDDLGHSLQHIQEIIQWQVTQVGTQKR